MIDKYKGFIKKVLCNKEYLNEYMVNNLINNIKEIKDGLYISRFIIDEKNYRIILSLLEEDVIINSSLTREYMNDSFDGFVKEMYINEEKDRFFKVDSSIYYSSEIIKETVIENEYSSRKYTKEQKRIEKIYDNVNTFDDIFIKHKKKTKSLF